MDANASHRQLWAWLATRRSWALGLAHTQTPWDRSSVDAATILKVAPVVTTAASVALQARVVPSAAALAAEVLRTWLSSEYFLRK